MSDKQQNFIQFVAAHAVYMFVCVLFINVSIDGLVTDNYIHMLEKLIENLKMKINPCHYF